MNKLCSCIGPQNGQPVCPCQMAYVDIINGRYVKRVVDLGPVPTKREMSLYEQILDAQKTVLSWSKEKRKNVQLEGQK